MIPSRRSGRSWLELLRVGADAGQRRLQVVADAAEEVVLGRVELQQLGVLRLDLGEQLGIADGGRHLAREQVEEVLVGRLPAARRGQPTDEHAEVLAAGAQDRPAGVATRRARPPPPRARRVAHDHGRVDQLERRSSHRPRSRSTSASTSSRARPPRSRQDPPELAVAPLEVRRQAVVALGQPRQLVVAGDLDRGRQVAGRHAVHRRATERSGASSSAARANDVTIAKASTIASAKNRIWRERRVGARSAERRLDDEDHDAEDRERARCAANDQRERQPGAEARVAAPSDRPAAAVRSSSSATARSSATGSPSAGLGRRRAGSRRRGPSGRGPAGSGRPRPSGGAGASSPRRRTGRRPRSRPSRGPAASRS